MQSDIWTAQEAIIPTLWCFLTCCFSCRITPSISASASPTLSFPSRFSCLRQRGPQVAVTRGKDDEELRSRASWLSPLCLHTVLYLTSPSSLLFFSYLSGSPPPSFQPASTIEWRSWGTASPARRRLRNECRHVTEALRSLISCACHRLLISWIRISLLLSFLKQHCLSFLGCIGLSWIFHKAAK